MNQYKTILFTSATSGGGIGKMIRFVSEVCVGKFEKVYWLHGVRTTGNDIKSEGVNELILIVSHNTSAIQRRFKQVRDIRKVIKKIDPNIVCCFGSEQAVVVALAMKGIKNIKLVQCDRGDPYTMPIAWKILAKWAFKQADNCVFQLEKQGKWYGEGIMKRSIVIPNPYIPTGKLVPYVGTRKKTIVSVGRFVFEKRYEVLIEAFSYVLKKHPDYKLVLYGEGPFKDKYMELIRNYHLEDSVFMPGYVTNSMESIKDAGLFVLSSYFEGMPNTLIEALSAGVPTVSTDCTPGGPDFLTNHGERGLLVPVNDAKAMSKAICKIIESPELRDDLSKKGKEIVPILDKTRISYLWLQFFESVME